MKSPQAPKQNLSDSDNVARLRGVLSALLIAQSKMQRPSDWYPGQTLRDFQAARESAKQVLRDTEPRTR